MKSCTPLVSRYKFMYEIMLHIYSFLPFALWIHTLYLWINNTMKSYIFIYEFITRRNQFHTYEFIHYIHEFIISWIHTLYLWINNTMKSYIFIYEFITRRNQFHTYEFIHYINEFIISWIHTFSYIFFRLQTSAIRTQLASILCTCVSMCVSSCIM